MSAQTEPDVCWLVPDDGGTPRDPGRLLPLGPQEFLIRARAEEGTSLLSHAVSRVDLICSNTGTQPRAVTLHLELSGDGERTNLDANHFGGMPTRDFIFLRPPGGDWEQANGRTHGWVATVEFLAQPGETHVGLSPWYTHGDYLHFIGSLPVHPHLTRALVGRSDAGREHWEVVITDPLVPAERKRRVFWQAREHAYESFSSFAMEGAVAHLLSEEAADIRRRFEIVLHPMANVDGVAEGYEYRAGYDAQGYASTASGRLAAAAVDRWQPEFVLAWHNWVAPRDVDVVFYTHGEGGQAARTAWDLFTQRFPSPRSTGHRWDSETDPNQNNWCNRPMQQERNVQEYAATRHGSRVWGWEMPWWNRTVADARCAGAAFVHAFFAAVSLLGATTPAVPAPTVPEVPRWGTHEFALHGRAHVENPFRDAALVGHFTSPTGRTVVAEGFYDGGDTWKLRFAPDEEGEWQYILRGEGVEVEARGRLRCAPPREHGPIRLHSENPYAFAYADGTPFFPMGDTCYGLHADSHITPELRTQYLNRRRGQRINFVRMGLVHSPTHWERDPSFWPWGGTPEDPDLDRLNPDYFCRLDAVLGEMKAIGMNAELIVLSFYQWPFIDTNLWTARRERMWLRYLAARYGASSNLFLWTIANEYETHPDGEYRLDVPGDPDWAKATARFLKQHDPYRHPVTVHPVMGAALPDGSTPRDDGSPRHRPWQIGEFFGDDDAIDVLSQQTGQAGEWDESQQCWVGNAPDLVTSLHADRRFRKPVLNSENGYEYLRGYPTYRQQVHHTDKVRRSSWRIVCAGGHFAAGFAGTVGQNDFSNRTCWLNPTGRERYSFVIRDEGAAGQLSILYDFFTALPFWRLQPFEGVTGEMAVALAEPAKLYVVYLPSGGEVSVDLSTATGSVTGRWFDPREGTFGKALQVTGGAKIKLAAPDENDWTLLLSSRPE